MFVPEKDLRGLILSYLKKQESSISGIARQLQRDGYRLHRLFVTGYLKALADLGMVREKEIPPSKVYSLAAYREKNLYEAVGERCRALEPDEDRATLLALGVLQRLFRRPIFARELRECGLPVGRDGQEAPAHLVEEARKILGKAGIHLSANEPAYFLPREEDGLQEQVLQDILVERFGVAKLVLETKQARLPDVAQA